VFPYRERQLCWSAESSLFKTRRAKLDHHFRGNIRFERSDGPAKQKRWLPLIDENDLGGVAFEYEAISGPTAPSVRRNFCGSAWGYRTTIWWFPSRTGRRSISPNCGDVIARTKLARLRFHDLRHAAYATHLLANGVHPKIASERLGHSKVGITLDLYSHVIPGMQEDAAAMVDAALKAAAQKRKPNGSNPTAGRISGTDRE
jgi:Phage integrase family